MRHASRAPRILAGSRKGKPLTVPAGQTTRPLRALARRSLFDILGPALQEQAFLDLFAGSGAVGLEAASRGASPVLLVDRGGDAIRALNDNVLRLELEQQAEVIRQDVARFLEGSPERPFPFVFMGPPFALFQERSSRTIERTFEQLPRWLAADGTLVVESPRPIQRPSVPGLTEVESRVYGESRLTFFRHPESSLAQG